jgi:carbonic anhydrase
MSKHTCEAVVIHCIDFRLQHHLNEWLTNRFGNKNYDRISIAGAIKDLDFVARQVEISHRLHETRKAILINHEDCGAYGAAGTKERHAIDLAEAESKIEALFPSLDVEIYYLHLDGTFEQLRKTNLR